jgi:VanZ family protein
MVVTLVLGWLDEAIQWAMPGRYYDWRDVGFKAFAGITVILARVAMARRWRRSKGRGHQNARR